MGGGQDPLRILVTAPQFLTSFIYILVSQQILLDIAQEILFQAQLQRTCCTRSFHRHSLKEERIARANSARGASALM
jgi:hypothetical protein